MNLKRRRSIRFVFLILFTLASHTFSTEFQGRIVDRGLVSQLPEKAGIKGASITLRDNQNNVVANASTNPKGLFRLRHVKPGHYQVVIQKKGYAGLPLVREIDISPGVANDTLERWFYLDPARFSPPKGGKKKSANNANPYALWAEGFLYTAEQPSFWNHSDSMLTLARIFSTKEDSDEFRRLWLHLLWHEVAEQKRSTLARVRMAQALDASLAKRKWSLSVLESFRDINSDSLENLSKVLQAIALGKPYGNKTAKSKKPVPATAADIKKLKIPNDLTLALILEFVESNALPMAKRKVLVSKVKGMFGTNGKRELEAALTPAKASRTAPRNPSYAESAPDRKRILISIREEGSASPANPVALFLQGLQELDGGNASEALSLFSQAEAQRPDEPVILTKKLEAHLQLKDTASAIQVLTILSEQDDVETQIIGQRGLGTLYFAGKKWELAEKALWLAHGLDAKSHGAQEAAFLLAEMGMARNAEGPTESLLENLVLLRPKDARPHLLLGQLALKRNQDGLAASHFEQAMSLAPREVKYAEALAKLQANQIEWAATLKTLTKHRSRLTSEGLSLYIDALLNTGRPADAVKECEALYGQAPSAKTLSRWAQALTAAQHPQKAIDLIRKSPYAQDEVVQVMLALALIDVGNTKEARTLLTPLVDAHPTDAILHLHLGRCFYASREYSKASGEFGDALRYRSDLSDALYYKGLSMLKMGRPGESHHYFQELGDRESRAWKAKGFLGRGQAFAQEDKPEAAEEYLRRSVALIPSAEASAHLGLVLLKAKKTSEAESWAKKARALDKHLAIATLAMVDMHLQNGQDEDGLGLAEAELESHPQSCEHLVIAAKANYQNNLDDRAKEICQRAVLTCVGDPGPHFYLGAISARSGDKQNAKGHFEAYVEAGGDIQNLPRGYR